MILIAPALKKLSQVRNYVHECYVAFAHACSSF